MQRTWAQKSQVPKGAPGFLWETERSSPFQNKIREKGWRFRKERKNTKSSLRLVNVCMDQAKAQLHWADQCVPETEWS
jgi:hypothetical protein